MNNISKKRFFYLAILIMVGVSAFGQNIVLDRSTQSILVNNVGGENNFSVTVNFDLTLVTMDNETNGRPSWFRLDETAFEESVVFAIEKLFKVTVDKNKPLKPRIGKISIYRNSLEVAIVNTLQNGSATFVTISADAANFESDAKTVGKTEKFVTSNVLVEITDIDHSVTAGQKGWLTVTPMNASHDDATQTSEKTFTLSVNSDNTNDNQCVAKFNVV